jgi:hypothetical protein
MQVPSERWDKKHSDRGKVLSRVLDRRTWKSEFEEREKQKVQWRSPRKMLATRSQRHRLENSNLGADVRTVGCAKKHSIPSLGSG